MANREFHIEEGIWNKLPEVVEVLKIMANKMTYLQGEHITMSDAYGAWLEIEARLRKMTKCPLAVVMLEKIIFRMADKNIVENDVMRAALFLDPRFKNMLTHIQKHKAETHLIYLNQKLDLKRDVHPRTLAVQLQKPEESDNVLEQILRDREISQQIINDTPSISRCDTLLAEIENFKDVGRVHAGIDVTEFWESKKFKYPKLYELARTVFSVAPTEVSVERNFSTLDFVFNKRRTKLTDSNLEMLLFIKLNKKMFYKTFDSGEFQFE